MKIAGAALLLLLAAAMAAPDTEAQMGGRSRGQGQSHLPELAPQPEATQQPRAAVADPVAALERELPSLRLDLKLTPNQSALWDSFEREARDIAEMGRQRLKHPAQPLSPDEAAPAAMTLLGIWADEDRSRSEAMADLKAKMDALYQLLSESQRKEFDRRVYLSQVDPLGSPTGSSTGERRRPPSWGGSR